MEIRETRKFDLTPIDNEHGGLAALTIGQHITVEKVDTAGRTRDSQNIWEEDLLVVPVNQIAQLVYELTDWMHYYASGTAQADRSQYNTSDPDPEYVARRAMQKAEGKVDRLQRQLDAAQAEKDAAVAAFVNTSYANLK